MSKDTLYYHIANLGLLIIGILSVYKAVGSAFVFMLILPGVLFGFFFSWQLKDKRSQNIEIFIGMLSLASAVIVLSRLYELEINFNNLLNIFSITLVWLGLFQSFGVRPNEGGYVSVQFISFSLFISSIALALEQISTYFIYLSIYLFGLIFVLRIDLIAGKRRKGSTIVGEKEAELSLASQLKISIVIFSIFVFITGLLFPFMPRLEDLSLQKLPSDLLGLPERIPLFKLISSGSFKIKESMLEKKSQFVDDKLKKREVTKEKPPIGFEEIKEILYNKDLRQIESLTVSPSSIEVPLNKTAQLKAEVKLTDGTVINVTNLVNWEVQESKVLEMTGDGNIRPLTEGGSIISASFREAFSNLVFATILPPQLPPKKINFIFYMLLFLWWSLLIALGYLYIRIMLHRAKLKRFAVESPRFFIKELYKSLCKILKVIGHPRMSHIAHREFVEILRGIQNRDIASLQQMTERFLEATFSAHDITKEDSLEVLKVFHNTVRGFFANVDFLKRVVGRVLMLEVPEIVEG